MTTRTTRNALCAGMFVLATLIFPLAASAQMTSCNWYADTALKQQQENELRKCGLSGLGWHTNRQEHLTWCATQNPDRWRAEAQRRQQLLAGCKK